VSNFVQKFACTADNQTESHGLLVYIHPIYELVHTICINSVKCPGNCYII